MTIGKVIRLADALKPNAIGLEQKYQYINEVEGLVQSEVMLLVSDDIVVYDCDATGADNTELLVKPPHDKLYIAYLVAMIDYANGEYNKYANTIEQFNTYYAEYHRWYFKHFHPADGECVERGYYLSAYTLAVLHGFEGDEDAFVASMVGKSPEMRYTADGKIIEWKYTTDGDGAWRELLDASEIKGDKGDKGDKGEPGNDGAKGEKGDKGDTGAKGEKGDKGDAFTYADFTAAQLAALKGEKGDKGETGAQGVPGDTGAQGEKGDKGDKGDPGEIIVANVTYSSEDEKWHCDMTYEEMNAVKYTHSLYVKYNTQMYPYMFQGATNGVACNMFGALWAYATDNLPYNRFIIWANGDVWANAYHAVVEEALAQTITADSADDVAPSAKAVADYVAAQLGDIVSLINAI